MEGDFGKVMRMSHKVVAVYRDEEGEEEMVKNNQTSSAQVPM
jgi:hypothetical protein